MEVVDIMRRPRSASRRCCGEGTEDDGAEAEEQEPAANP